jgi:hypothetical protein
MATINPVWAAVPMPHVLQTLGTTVKVETRVQYVTITWTAITSATSDVCTPAPAGWLVDKSVTFTGTVTSLALHGSNDNVTYLVLADPQGNAMTALNAAGIEQFLETPLWVKPVVTTGVVTVILFGRVPAE